MSVASQWPIGSRISTTDPVTWVGNPSVDHRLVLVPANRQPSLPTDDATPQGFSHNPYTNEEHADERDSLAVDTLDNLLAEFDENFVDDLFGA